MQKRACFISFAPYRFKIGGAHPKAKVVHVLILFIVFSKAKFSIFYDPICSLFHLLGSQFEKKHVHFRMETLCKEPPFKMRFGEKFETVQR